MIRPVSISSYVILLEHDDNTIVVANNIMKFFIVFVF